MCPDAQQWDATYHCSKLTFLKYLSMVAYDYRVLAGFRDIISCQVIFTPLACLVHVLGEAPTCIFICLYCAMQI